MGTTKSFGDGVKLIDKTTQRLFGEFPREVGNPKRRMVYNRGQFETFITENDGVNDVFVSSYANGVIDKLFYDFDGFDSGSHLFEDVKLFYQSLLKKKYPTIPAVSGKKGYHIHQLLKPEPITAQTKDMLTEATRSLLSSAFSEGKVVTYFEIILPKLKNADEQKRCIALHFSSGEIREVFVDPLTSCYGNIRQLVRVPNTLRPPENLNYCTYLPPDFSGMSEKEVAEHIKSPHDYDYDLRNPPALSELCGGVKTRLLNSEQKSLPQGERIDWIIERYVPKVIEGSEYWMGRCPFHSDKDPSFAVYSDHFHCYGCGAHGDIIDFINLMRKKGGGKIA